MKHIFLIIITLISISCNKKKASSESKENAVLPAVSPTRDKFYHKSRWFGAYLNVNDLNDTIFIYNRYFIQNDDTNTANENNQYVDKSNYGPHYIYTKHKAEHWGGNYALYQDTPSVSYKHPLFPHLEMVGGGIYGDMNQITATPGVGTMQPIPSYMVGINHGLTIGYPSYCINNYVHQVNMYLDSSTMKFYLTYNNIKECPTWSGPVTYTFVKQ